jgi:hypothetical protein
VSQRLFSFFLKLEKNSLTPQILDLAEKVLNSISRLLALTANQGLILQKLASDELSSLFSLIISDEEKMFYKNI